MLHGQINIDFRNINIAHDTTHCELLGTGQRRGGYPSLIPIHEPKFGRQAQRAVPEGESPRRQRHGTGVTQPRVLLVEDDPGLGRAVQDQILAEGHSVDRVKTVADARACAQIVIDAARRRTAAFELELELAAAPTPQAGVA